MTSPSSRFAVICGVGSAALGAAVVAGRYSSLASLGHIHASFVPMHLFTAMEFLVAGAAVILTSLGCRRSALIVAAIGGGIGLLTLLEHVLGRNIGIDNMLTRYFIASDAFQPGRMAPNIALCFTMSALSILLFSSRREPSRPAHDLPSGLIGAAISSLGAAALYGYLSGTELTYGWSSLTRMTFHTAGGLIVLGAGHVAIYWSRFDSPYSADSVVVRQPTRKLIPIILGLLIAIFVSIWHLLVARDEAVIRDNLRTETQAIVSGLNREFSHEVVALERMAYRWAVRKGTPRSEWNHDAGEYARDFRNVRVIGWVDPTFHVRWIVPAKENEGMEGRDLGIEPRQRAALEEARIRRKTIFQRTTNLVQGENEILVEAPIAINDYFDGYILCVYRVEPLLNTIFGALTSQHGVAVFDGEEKIFHRFADAEIEAIWSTEQSLDLYGIPLRIKAWPTAERLHRGFSVVPHIVLLLGLGITGLVIWSSIKREDAEIARRRAEEAGEVIERQVAQLASHAEKLEKADLAIKEANVQLRNLDEMKDEFIATLSHELRTPIAACRGASENLLEGHLGQLNENQRRTIEIVMRNSTRLTGLVTDLLDLARMRSGKYSVIRNSHNLVEILLTAKNDIQAQAEKDGKVIVMKDFPTQRVMIDADPERITQIFLNLVQNALKFGRKEINVRLIDQGDHARLSIEDDGPGISEDCIEQIFEKFHTSRGTNGIGLGLTIVRKLVDAHDGKVWAENRSPAEGGGSRFVVLFQKKSEL